MTQKLLFSLIIGLFVGFNAFADSNLSSVNGQQVDFRSDLIDFMNKDLFTWTESECRDLINKYQRLPELSRATIPLYILIGTCYFQIKDYSSAVSYLEKVVNFSDEGVHAWGVLALVYKAQHKPEMQDYALRKYISIIKSTSAVKEDRRLAWFLENLLSSETP